MPLDIDRIEKSVRRVTKFLAKAPKDPTPKKVHDLRTSARRLEAAVEALGLVRSGARNGFCAIWGK